MIAMLNTVLLSALIAFGAQAPAQTTPRALLERGALAEEHQRDFAGAQKLYEQAETAAKETGDSKTAAEAGAAKERVLARQGKGPAPSQAQDAAVQQQLVHRAVSMLFKAQNDNPSPEHISRAAQPLVDLGPGVIDVLALSLTDSTSADGKSKPPHVPEVAARALALMQTPEADRALIAAYDSADPTIRKAVVEAASDQRFLDLSLRAATDPVASIRDLVATRLLNVEDPRAVEAVVALMGSSQQQDGMRQAAASWLARNAPTRLLQVAFDASRPQDQRAAALGVVRGEISDAVLLDLLRRTRALSAADETTRELAIKALESVRLPGAEATAERDELASELARVEQLDLDAWAVIQLAAIKPSAAMPPLLAALARRRGAARGDDLVRLLVAIDSMRSATSDRVDFAAWTKVALACDASWRAVTYKSKTRAIQEHIWASLAKSEPAVPLAVWGQTWNSIPDSHRHAYVQAFLSRLLRNLQRGPKERGGADAHALLTHMLAADDKSLPKPAMEQLELEADPHFIADACRAHERGLANAIPYLRAAFRATPQDTLTRMETELMRRVKSEQAASPKESALYLLTALDASAALPTWERLWLAAKSPSARAELLEALLHPDWAGPEVAARLVELYPAIERDQPALRKTAIAGFADGLVEQALPILEREIRNPDSIVRTSAMNAAEAFRKHREAVAEFEAWRKVVTVEQSTVAELSKLLESPNRDVVLGAVKALAILRARPALPALVKLLERDDKELRAAVQAALDAIGA